MNADLERRYIRYMPSMRSAYIERFEGGPHATTFYSKVEYLDESLLSPSKQRRIGRTRFVLTLLRTRVDVLAIPEPFWIAELPYTTLIALAGRLSGLMRGRRTELVTYAIENADAGNLMGLRPRLPRRVRLFALAMATFPVLVMLSRVAFGTDAARANYIDNLPSFLARRIKHRSRLFVALAPRCECMTEDFPSTSAPTALFLGPLATRKGVDTLLDAWSGVRAVVPQARLTICGEGALLPLVDQAVRADSSITHVGRPSRDEIHARLRRSQVLVTLPRPERRWTEQIGLSVTEGLSHECHIVTTRQTGLSSWLEDHGQTVIDVGASRGDIVARLSAALTSTDRSLPALPSTSGRAHAEWWMCTERAR